MNNIGIRNGLKIISILGLKILIWVYDSTMKKRDFGGIGRELGNLMKLVRQIDFSFYYALIMEVRLFSKNFNYITYIAVFFD